jgi:hypothetical protein
MSTNPRRIAELSAATEIRAAENHHQARMGDAGTIRVTSDTTPGLEWIVRAWTSGPGVGIVFECRPSDPGLAAGRGHMPHASRIPGDVPCVHCATAARRMEREGLARWDGGLWVATPRACAVAPSDVDDGDPFAGFGAA